MRGDMCTSVCICASLCTRTEAEEDIRCFVLSLSTLIPRDRVSHQTLSQAGVQEAWDSPGVPGALATTPGTVPHAQHSLCLLSKCSTHRGISPALLDIFAQIRVITLKGKICTHKNGSFTSLRNWQFCFTSVFCYNPLRSVNPIATSHNVPYSAL